MTIDLNAARGRSAVLLQDAYMAANQQSTVDTNAADQLPDRERLKAYGDASDRRAEAFRRAEQDNQDRLARLAAVFGQYYRGPGRSGAPAAVAFVAALGDPAADLDPAPGPVIHQMVTVSFLA